MPGKVDANLASSNEGAPGATPQRPWPMSTSTSTPMVTRSFCVMSEIILRLSALSTATISLTRRANSTSRAILIGPTISLAMRMLVDSDVGERFGFAEFGASDADGAGLYLHLGDGRAFVAFEMRTQLGVTFGKVSAHELEICFQRIDIDEQRGRVEIRHGRSLRKPW